MFPKHSHMAHQRPPRTCKNSEGYSLHRCCTSHNNRPTVRCELPEAPKSGRLPVAKSVVSTVTEVARSFKVSKACTYVRTHYPLLTHQTRSSFIVLPKKKKTTSKVDCREPLKSRWVYVTPKNSHKYFEGTLEYWCLFKTNRERTLR